MTEILFRQFTAMAGAPKIAKRTTERIDMREACRGGVDIFVRMCFKRKPTHIYPVKRMALFSPKKNQVTPNWSNNMATAKEKMPKIAIERLPSCP